MWITVRNEAINLLVSLHPNPSSSVTFSGATVMLANSLVKHTERLLLETITWTSIVLNLQEQHSEYQQCFFALTKSAWILSYHYSKYERHGTTFLFFKKSVRTQLWWAPLTPKSPDANHAEAWRRFCSFPDQIPGSILPHPRENRSDRSVHGPSWWPPPCCVLNLQQPHTGGRVVGTRFTQLLASYARLHQYRRQPITDPGDLPLTTICSGIQPFMKGWLLCISAGVNLAHITLLPLYVAVENPWHRCKEGAKSWRKQNSEESNGTRVHMLSHPTFTLAFCSPLQPTPHACTINLQWQATEVF